MMTMPFMTPIRVCFFLTLCACAGLVCPSAVLAQDESVNIVYEQTGPPRWDPIKAANGFPQEAPPYLKAGETSDASNEESFSKDIYDSLDDYSHDYLSSESGKTGVTNDRPDASAEAGNNALKETSGTCFWVDLPYPFLALAAIAILVTLIVIRLLLSKSTPLNPHGHVDMGQVIGELQINANTTLYYVKTGGDVLVIGVTPHNIALITKLPDTTTVSPFDLGSQTKVTANTGSILEKKIVPHTELALLRNDIQELQRSISRLQRKTYYAGEEGEKKKNGARGET
jgi:flagellar biogenesis protein FliO